MRRFRAHRLLDRSVLWSRGNGMVSDMAPGEADDRAGAGARPSRGHRLVSFALLIVCGGTFGLIFSANKIAVTGGIPFFAYVFWQTLGAGLVLLLFAAVLRRRPRLSWPYARAYFVIGFFTLAFPFVLLAFIAPKLPAGVISLGGTLSPTITYVLALALAMDRFRWLRIGGIALGLAGVLLVVLPETSLPDSDMAGWVLLSLLVPVSYASGTIAAARLAPADGDSLTMGSGLLFASSIMVFPFMAGSGQWWFFSGPDERQRLGANRRHSDQRGFLLPALGDRQTGRAGLLLNAELCRHIGRDRLGHLDPGRESQRLHLGRIGPALRRPLSGDSPRSQRRLTNSELGRVHEVQSRRWDRFSPPGHSRPRSAR